MEKIVTFSCSKSIHVYTSSSIVKPMLPYKIHGSIDSAKKYLLERNGLCEIKVIYN